MADYAGDYDRPPHGAVTLSGEVADMSGCRRNKGLWLGTLPFILVLSLSSCDGDNGSDEPMDPDGSDIRYLVQGSDMGNRFQNVEVLGDGTDPVTDATVTVNGVALDHVDGGFYSGQLSSNVPAGDPIVLVVQIGEQVITGTDVMPEAPAVTGPADGSTFSTTDDIVVTWTSASDPDRFSISAVWVEGNAGRAMRFDASASLRSLTISAADLPTGPEIEIRVFSYNDGSFSGPFMEGSQMSIRGEQGGNPTITITP